MRRLLIVGKDMATTTEMTRRARALTRRLDDGTLTEIVIVTDGSAATGRWAALAAPELRRVVVHRHAYRAERVDAGAMLRPLPDELVVVGTDPDGGDVDALAELIGTLRTNPDAAVVHLDAPGGLEGREATRHGFAARTGPLCQAGGLLAARPLGERLEGIGFATVALPGVPELVEVTS